MRTANGPSEGPSRSCTGLRWRTSSKLASSSASSRSQRPSATRRKAPKRPIRVRMVVGMFSGTGYFARRLRASMTSSAVCPAAAAFHRESSVRRQVWTYSGLLTSSAHINSTSRASVAWGEATSNSTVWSDCRMSGLAGW